MERFVHALLLAAVVAGAAPRAWQGDAQAVRKFTEQVQREWPGKTKQHEITVASLDLLAAAIESVATKRGTAPAGFATEYDRLRAEIRELEGEAPDTWKQTAGLQHTLLTASSLMRRLAGEAAEVEPLRSRLAAMRRSADSLNRRQPLRQQPDVLERFFNQSAELLQELWTR